MKGVSWRLYLSSITHISLGNMTSLREAGKYSLCLGVPSQLKFRILLLKRRMGNSGRWEVPRVLEEGQRISTLTTRPHVDLLQPLSFYTYLLAVNLYNFVSSFTLFLPLYLKYKLFENSNRMTQSLCIVYLA